MRDSYLCVLSNCMCEAEPHRVVMGCVPVGCKDACRKWAPQAGHLNLEVFWRSAHKTGLRVAQGDSSVTCLCKMLIDLHP